VRVVLDGNLPRGLAPLLTDHVVHTIHSRRWSDLDDGALLAACEREYDVFVTMDQSLRFQQNLRGRNLSVVLVHARSNRLSDLEPIVPQLLAVLQTAVRGEVSHVGV
jgi:predicted nuclease of predicted toxin-antitoxin system